MDEIVLQSFTEKWLSSWTGNQPEILLDFYSEDAFYSDPSNLMV